MNLTPAVFAGLQNIPIKRSKLKNLRKCLYVIEHFGHEDWVATGEIPYPFTGYQSIDLVIFIIRLCDLWGNWEYTEGWDLCYKNPPGRQGAYTWAECSEEPWTPYTWADFLVAIDEGIREVGFSSDPDATFEHLALAVLSVAEWDDRNRPCPYTGESLDVVLFIYNVSCALEVPLPPPPEEVVEPAVVEVEVDAPQPAVEEVEEPAPRSRGSRRRTRALSYQDEMSRETEARRRYNLRSTRAREERMEGLKEADKAKRKAEGKAGSSSKASGRRSRR